MLSNAIMRQKALLAVLRLNGSGPEDMNSYDVPTPSPSLAASFLTRVSWNVTPSDRNSGAEKTSFTCRCARATSASCCSKMAASLSVVSSQCRLTRFVVDTDSIACQP